MHLPILIDLVAILGLSLPVLWLCNRLHIPTIVGFLSTGILLGPSALRFITNLHEINTLAEIGVVLLLFTIGIEFSLRNLLRNKRNVILGGMVQVGLTVCVAAAISWSFGMSWRVALFVGMLVSLSSTALVLKILQERAQIDTAHGGMSIGILIFQDIAVVPMMVFTPFIAGGDTVTVATVGVLLLKVIGLMVVVIAAARWLIPYGLLLVARTRDNELFLLSVVFLALATAWLTAEAGLSLALGAFLAGLIISESEYSHRAMDSIVGFRDVFTSFFFVSIGLLVDLHMGILQFLLVLGIAATVMLVKLVAATIAGLTLRLPFETAALSGIALCQLGEFSFILSRLGVETELLSEHTYRLFLTISVLTMIVSPFLIMTAQPIVRLVERLPMPRRLRAGAGVHPEATPVSGFADHLIVVGLGITGRNVVMAAIEALVPYEIIEMNPDTVQNEREQGEIIHYGDASQPSVLRHAGVERARVLVVTVPDAAAVRRVVELARGLNPELHIIARTRFVREIEPLIGLGANEVIPEEYETSVEIFTRVMHRYQVPADAIARFVDVVRARGYDLLRTTSSRHAHGPRHVDDSENV
jgi:monovalent cation:H+ antiporter-2, CPA2 family